MADQNWKLDFFNNQRQNVFDENNFQSADLDYGRAVAGGGQHPRRDLHASLQF
jgi:hypothetical protein